MADLHEIGFAALADPVTDAFVLHLAGTRLARRTRETYRERVGNFVRWLRASGAHPDALLNAAARDVAVSAYFEHLVAERDAVARTLNTTLAALDAFYEWQGLGRPAVGRVSTDLHVPRTLDDEQISRFLAAAAEDARDYALVAVGLDAAPLETELAGLDEDDVELSARGGNLRIGDRVVPLEAGTRAVLLAWRAERRKMLGPMSSQRALFVSKRGRRLAPRSVDFIIRSVGRRAGMEISPGTLRNTAEQRLLVAGWSPSAVAAFLGNTRPDMARVRALTQLSLDFEA
ncbi:site-specific integrase [Nocardia tengchongensis]|uniref:site-specific integrase n=1 Tax=Nocardia tengchongensis TaxID=2055889 RepID=UPI00361F23C3